MKNILILLFLVTTPYAKANITGTHLQNFNPTSDGLCFVTVHCSQILEPGFVNLGIFANYASNSLPFFRDPSFPSSQNLSEPNNKLLSSDVSIGLGILKNWDVGVAFPFVLDQQIDNYANLGTYDKTGLTEWKVNTKARIAGNELWGMAVVGNVAFDRIANNPFSGNDPGPTVTGELVYDYRINADMLWGANIGYRLRNDGSTVPGTGVSPIGDQYIYSTGINYWYQNWATTFIGEIYGSLPKDNQDLPIDRKVSNMELLLGAKHTFSERWDAHAGITHGIYDGLATPDYRIYLGLNLRVGPLLSKSKNEAPTIVSEPIPPVPVEEKPDEVVVLHSMNFDTNLTTLKKDSQLKFQDTLKQLQKNSPNLRKIIVEGHTDNVGTDAKNMILSQGRAETVRNLIIRGLKLSPDQVKAVGRGENTPIESNDSSQGRAKNRRVELKIYRQK